MGFISVRELTNRTSEVLNQVTSTGRPVIVSRRGQPIVAMVPIAVEELEDWILANAPEFVVSMAEADEDIAAGRARLLDDVLSAFDEEDA